jgi:hypothetical protein
MLRYNTIAEKTTPTMAIMLTETRKAISQILANSVFLFRINTMDNARDSTIAGTTP